jgi:hypothetical protein
MSNVIYPILILIFAFGATVAYINETGLYEQKLPESGVTATLQQVNDTNTAMLESSKNPLFSAIEQASIFGKVIFGGVLALFTIGPTLAALGIPTGMVGVFLSPLGIVLLFAIFEWWFGRSSE